MDANLLLWIVQILLALAFVAAGYGHVFEFREDGGPAQDGLAAGRRADRDARIGILEILGGGA